MWTKSVLLFGALALGSLLLLQLLPLEYFYVLPVSARAPGSLFEGLGPAVRFWIGLLAIALVRDYVVSRRGVPVTDVEMAAVRLERHRFHGEWNYTIRPATKRRFQSVTS